MTARTPDESEMADIVYGREIAKKVAGLDIGQTIVVADRACVAVEAMEGTDAAIQRAASLSNGKRLVVVKVSKPQQDMRFDVPVVGVRTIRVMQRSNAHVLAVDAGRTLLFEREQLIAEADQAGISVVGMKG
jgi:UDP-2,3-diacylglucosamine hydrolase